MTYEEFKGELYRIIMQQEEIRGRKILLLEKGYTASDSRTLNMIRYINRVTLGREDDVIHADYIHVIWGEGSIRSMMNWDIQECFEKYKKEGWQGLIPELLGRIQRCGLSEEWLQLDNEGYEQVRDRLILRPINYQFNQLELEECIYWKFGDIAMTLYGVVYDGEDDYLTMKMKREMTGKWGLGDEELLGDAFRNTMELMPPRLYRSTDLRSKHSREEGVFMEPERSMICRDVKAEEDPFTFPYRSYVDGVLGYRLTTTKSLNGAIAIFYPGVCERLAELFGDFYIGFTSIHEAIIHPAEHQSPVCMKESIRSVNAMFPREEMLTDRIYRYFADTREMAEI